VIGLVTACVPQTPILIYITPTPDPAAAEAVVGAAASPSPMQPTPNASGTPEPTIVPTIRSPRATVIGPVVGPEYSPPPTNTPPFSPTPEPTTTIATGTIPPRASATPTPAGPRPTTLPNLDTQEIGIQVHSLLDQADWDEVLRRVADLQVGWVKIQIDWELMQPGGPEDISEDFRRQELYLESLDQRGIKVLISVAKAPAWARSVTDESGPPDDPQDLARFINLMLAEFGEVIDAVEVWNEPNLQREWQGQPLTGQSYMQYFDAAYEVIRGYSDTMTIVTGGLAPTSNLPGSTDDREYLRQMYAAGLGNYDDIVIGVHPYGWGNPPDATCCDPGDDRGWDDDPHFFFSDTMTEYREIMTANGHGDLPVWVTEFGWTAWEGFPGEPPDLWMTYTDKWEQANYTMRAFEIGQASDEIGPMFLWNLNFGVLPGLVEARQEMIAYSLLVLDYPERPLYWMIYDAMRPDLELERYD
jgi:hypothetical protein